jgi:hypothetical protein
MSILARRLAVIVSWIGHPLVFVTMSVGIIVTTQVASRAAIPLLAALFCPSSRRPVCFFLLVFARVVGATPMCPSAKNESVFTRSRQLSKETVNNYGVGFIGVHDGRGAAFVFVDFWGNENELFHRVFLSRDNDPEKLAPTAPADSSVCVWDLHLQSLSARLGSAMCCAKLARPISMVILPNVCTKMPNF